MTDFARFVAGRLFISPRIAQYCCGVPHWVRDILSLCLLPILRSVVVFGLLACPLRALSVMRVIIGLN
jgi:hypothetical protein